MTNEQLLRTALTDLVTECRDYFYGHSGFPLADALERAEKALQAIELLESTPVSGEPPASNCPKHESGQHWCGNCFKWLES